MADTIASSHLLTKQEVERFHRDGWIGPYAFCTPEEMQVLRRSLERTLLGTTTVFGRTHYQTRHLDNPVVLDLCTRAQILDRLETLLGPDLVLWQSNQFIKEPHGGPSVIQWHQDRDSWEIEPPLAISAWLAIDDVDVDNGCVHVIPGSHRETIPHVLLEYEQSRPRMQADPAAVDVSRAVPIEMRAGHFFLFTERLLHHSPALRTHRRRWGMAARYTVPFVRVLEPQPVLMVRGSDRFGFNTLGTAPAS